MPCILNAANEVAVAAFLEGKIRFMDIPRLVSHVMNKTPLITDIYLSDLIESNTEARARAEEALKNNTFTN